MTMNPVIRFLLGLLVDAFIAPAWCLNRALHALTVVSHNLYQFLHRNHPGGSQS